MLNLCKKLRYFALGGLVLQLGCGSEWLQDFWIAGVTSQAFEFLLDNDGILDLFAD